MPDQLLTWGATVTRVIDGDTFEVVWDNGYIPPGWQPNRIRIAGIDTNELYPVAQSFGQAAADRLAELLTVGAHVTLQAVDESSNSDGRPLRHVFVNGVNVATILLSEGLGLAVTPVNETDYRDEYFEAAESAQLAGLGMWAVGASGGDPSTWSDIEVFVNYDAGGDDYLNLNDEYVEITNNGPGPLDMTGWTFRKNGKESTIAIPDGTVLQAGETFRVYTGSGNDTAFKMYLGLSAPLWANDHDVIYLRDQYLNIRGYQAWPDSIFESPEFSIVIDDVQYDGPGDDAINPNGEWIIIRNAGAETVDLSGWRIKDDGSDYVFGEGETLAAGETLKIFIGVGTDSEGVRYWGQTSGILVNEGGRLEIWTPQSQSVDVFTWGGAQSLDENPRGAIRMFANFDAEGNDTTNPNGEWIALQNTSDSAIDIGGYSVKYGSQIYTFAAGTILAAGANIRVMGGSGTDTATTFYWGKSSGFLSNSGGFVDLINTDAEVLLRHEWPNPSSDVTDYGLVISSVNYDAVGSDADNPNGEWIIIRNASSAEQNLLNWQIAVGSKHFVILKDTPMQPGDVVTIFMGSGTDTANTLYWGNAGGILSNTGSTGVQLLNPQRDVVESHSWGSAASDAQSVAAAIDILVNYDAPGIDEENPNGEWVTLTNNSSQTISLDGYHLYTDGTTYTFDSGDVLQAGQRIRVYLGNGVDNGLDRYANGSLNIFNNIADEVELRRNDTGMAVDYFSYPAEGPEASIVIDDVQYNAPGDDAINPNGEWIIIRNAGSETVELAEWRVKSGSAYYDFADGETLDPGETLKIFLGVGTDSEGIRYWGQTSGILVNEGGRLEIWTPLSQVVDAFTWGGVQSLDENPRGAIRMFANFDAEGNDTTNPNGEWIALQNTSDSAIDIGGYKVKYGSQVYTFAAGTILAAGANIRVMGGSGTDTATTFYWGKSSGFLSNSGGFVDLINTDAEVLLRHEWPNPSSDVTDYGLVISTVYYDAPGSDADNPNGEWITIRNASAAEQNLLNWQITVGSKHFVILKDTPMQPGDVVTIFMGSGTDTANTLYWGNAGGILSNTGATAVTLLNPNRDVVETHSWGSAASDAQSVAAAIDISVNYDAPGVDEDNLNGEWITLTNLSSQAISLDGYHLYTDGTTYTFDSGDVLQAGQRIRVYLGNGADNGLDRYANGGLNTLANTGDEVELRRNDTGMAVDYFSYPFVGQPLVQGQFEITAVNPDAPGVDDNNVNGEWIEITNTGSSAANLLDWRIQYQTGAFYDFGASVVVAAGATVRLHMGQGTNTPTEFYWGNTAALLSNTTGNLSLQSNYRVEAHTYQWRLSPGVANTITGTDGANTIQTFDGQDTLRGGGGTDRLYGGAGNDSLFGEAGDDILDGGAGADQMTGGLGDDTYVVDNVGDVIVETTGQGNDTVRSSINFAFTGQSLENLILTGSDNINATANSLANKIVGNSGNNILDGKTGADLMTGGLGDDTYVVDHVGDVIVETTGQGNDTVRSSISFAFTGQSLENLVLAGSANINATANSLANILVGNSGNNVLDGKTGADHMTGGKGNDTYVVDNVGDVIVETTGQGNDTVRSSISFAFTGQSLENLTLTGSADINGSANSLNNIVTGNSGANTLDGKTGNDVLDGGAGADTLIGGMGDDTYVIDNVGDVIIETTGQGNDTVRSSISFAFSGQSLEDLILTGTANINATANSKANIVTGNSGNNVINGMGGADTLTGGGGSDTFVFNSTAHSTVAASDVITDLSNDDFIDLSKIDANTTVGGKQTFSLVDAFTNTAGQVTLSYDVGTNITSLMADTNGDGVADMLVRLNGGHEDHSNFIFGG